MNTKNYLSLLLLLTTLAVQAQVSNRIPRGKLYLVSQVQFPSFNNLNHALTEADYAPVKVSFGSGTGGYGSIHRWIIGGEGNNFSAEKKENGKITSMNGGWGFLFAGYVLSKGKVLVYPSLGIGGGGAAVHLIKNAGNNNLGDLLATEGNSTSISMGSFLVNTAISCEYPVGNQMDIALKASYVTSLQEHAWQADGMSPSVSDSFGGLTLAFQFGFRL